VVVVRDAGIAERASGTHVLVVDGELDVATAPRLVSAFDDALATRPPALLIDVSQVDFADSSGLAALIRCRRRAVRHNSRLLLDAGDGAVARILELTHLHQVFDLV
jgi:anti-anti-sigma factor